MSIPPAQPGRGQLPPPHGHRGAKGTALGKGRSPRSRVNTVRRGPTPRGSCPFDEMTVVTRRPVELTLKSERFFWRVRWGAKACEELTDQMLSSDKLHGGKVRAFACSPPPPTLPAARQGALCWGSCGRAVKTGVS